MLTAKTKQTINPFPSFNFTSTQVTQTQDSYATVAAKQSKLLNQQNQTEPEPVT